jgi:hypothetical protein
VARGYSAILPSLDVTDGAWKGTGYIVLDLETGSAGYMLSGGLAGGVAGGIEQALGVVLWQTQVYGSVVPASLGSMPSVFMAVSTAVAGLISITSIGLAAGQLASAAEGHPDEQKHLAVIGAQSALAVTSVLALSGVGVAATLAEGGSMVSVVASFACLLTSLLFWTWTAYYETVMEIERLDSTRRRPGQ